MRRGGRERQIADLMVYGSRIWAVSVAATGEEAAAFGAAAFGAAFAGSAATA